MSVGRESIRRAANAGAGKTVKKPVVSTKEAEKPETISVTEEKKKTNSLNKKIKAIHATSGDQKIADYNSRVKDSRIIKVDFATNTIKNQSFAVTNIPVYKFVKKIVNGEWKEATEFNNGDQIKTDIVYDIPAGILSTDNRVISYQLPDGVLPQGDLNGVVYCKGSVSRVMLLQQ